MSGRTHSLSLSLTGHSEYLSPVLNKLSVLHNFTIESQVQFHAPLAFEPRPIEHDGRPAHGLTHEDLTVFINSAEWTLCEYLVTSRRVHSYIVRHSVECVK